MLKFKAQTSKDGSPVPSEKSSPSSSDRDAAPPGELDDKNSNMSDSILNNNEPVQTQDKKYVSVTSDGSSLMSSTPPGEVTDNMEFSSDKDNSNKLADVELQDDGLSEVVPDSDSGDNSSTAPVSRSHSNASHHFNNGTTGIEEITEGEGVLVINGKTVDKNHKQLDEGDGENGDVKGKEKGKPSEGRKGSLFGKLFKKLSRPSEPEQSPPPMNVAKLERVMQEVHINSLPQVFVTKYLGSRLCTDLYGIKTTRGPVDEMIASVQGLTEGDDLPLVQLRVSGTGIHVKEHSANKAKDSNIERGMIPIEFISYGVQDVKFTRVFSFILVREISSRSRELECHAYICDSTVSARKLALSVSLAFKKYSDSLQGQPFKFQVDLGSQKDTEHDTNSKDIDA